MYLTFCWPPWQTLVHVELARDGVEVLERLGRARRVEHGHGHHGGRGGHRAAAQPVPQGGERRRGGNRAGHPRSRSCEHLGKG